jgi:hypothetical protein
MIRYLVTIFLLAAFIAQTFSKSIILVHFFANQNYISQNLCENSGKPQMKCCGRCVLKKKLKQEENNNDQLPSKKQQNNNDQVGLSIISYNPYSIIISPEYNHVPNLQTFTGAVHNIFHPPGSFRI